MSRTFSRSSILGFTLLLVAACAEDPGSLSKDEARRLGGKADVTDFCADYGWYGDDICDDFCPQPDPDCGGGEQHCGGFAGLACPGGQFCDYDADAMCGAADQMGVCRPMPDACAAQYDPVCGCDGQTYSSACDANAVGVAVFASGACADEPSDDWCGGFAGRTCGDREYCHYEPSDTCGWADATGTCQPMPDVCPAVVQPVCGCDGRTYDNACIAHRSGTSVRVEGSCH